MEQEALPVVTPIQMDMMGRATAIVRSRVNDNLDKSDPKVIFDVYIVWFSKTLKNWKALLSTTLPDGRYYEVTHNGETGDTYLDTYVKVDNMVYGYA